MQIIDLSKISIYDVLVPTGSKEGMNAAGLVTAQELSRRTGMSESVIYDLASRDEIPNIKIGRWTRFKWTSILKWLDDQERGS